MSALGPGRIGARRPGVLRWILLALVLQLVLAVLDVAASDRVIFTSSFVLAPFALAVSGHARSTAAAGVIAVVLAIASGHWNHYAGSVDHLVRITIVATGSILATLAARAIDRSREQRARMALLAAVGDLAGTERTEEAIQGLTARLVPAAADTCWVDVDEPDGRRRRLFEHGPDAPPTDAPPDERTALIPLKNVGVLGLRTAAGRYDEDTRRFFTILAGRVALVLANARLVSDLRSIRARLDGVLGSLAEAVTVHDDRGQTIYANPAAARLLGAETPEELVQARPGELAARFTVTLEDGTPVALDDLPGRRLIKGERAPELLTRSIDRRTGQGYWLLTKATLLHDQGRDHAVNIIEDVTSAKDAERRQRFLDEAGQLLAASLDYGETLQRVAELAVKLLAESCTIVLPTRDGQLELAAHSGETTGTEVTAVPIPLGDGTAGTLSLAGTRRFSEADVAFAHDLALRAGTAIQNARLYEDQARVARTLQASLLPKRLPVLEGWASAASYQAGEQGADVGGDFYDIVPTTSGRQLVFLGDVTGKGIAAAALTSLVRHSVRTAARFDPSPGEILALVNEILVEQPELSPVTLVCGLIDGNTLTVAAAGHPPPLLKRHSNVQELGAAGVLLGVISGQRYAQHAVDLQAGDMVLLYTDGVTDTPGEDARYGPQRLAGLLEHAPDEPQAVLDAIEADLEAFQHGTAIDDRAMLVLRFNGAGTLEQAA